MAQGEVNKSFYLAHLAGLRELSEYDSEVAHGDADNLLCELLTRLGYGDVVEAWKKVKKYYA